GVLRIKYVRRGHRHQPHFAPAIVQALHRLRGDADFGSRGDDERLRGAGAVDEYVTAARDRGLLLGAARLLRESLPGENERGRTFGALDGRDPGNRGLERITG